MLRRLRILAPLLLLLAACTRAEPPPRQTPALDDGATKTLRFCAVEREGLQGYVRYQGDPPSECSVTRFTADVPARFGFEAGAFVPRCLQPELDKGMRLVVGTVCVTEDLPRQFTEDPRPESLRGQLADGDVIPFCKFDHSAYPDYPILVGPPCVLLGVAAPRIVEDNAAIESAATCTAGLVYLLISAELALEALAALDITEPLSPAARRTRLTAAMAALAAPPPERVAAFFEGWTPERSAIAINLELARTAEALGENWELEDAAPLRDQLSDAVDWYTAGRDC